MRLRFVGNMRSRHCLDRPLLFFDIETSAAIGYVGLTSMRAVQLLATNVALRVEQTRSGLLPGKTAIGATVAFRQRPQSVPSVSLIIRRNRKGVRPTQTSPAAANSPRAGILSGS